METGSIGSSKYHKNVFYVFIYIQYMHTQSKMENKLIYTLKKTLNSLLRELNLHSLIQLAFPFLYCVR